MERGFGHDFGAVRVHADDRAGAAARALRARAVTVGHDIAFASGAYAPGTPDGRRLLAHELAHTIQQGGRAPAGSTPDRSGERAADAAAHRVLAGGRAHLAATAPSGPQLEEPAAATTTATDPGEEIVKGLKTMGEKVLSNTAITKQIETEVIPVVDRVAAGPKADWQEASGVEKGVAIGAGAGMLGGAYAAALTHPQTRTQLTGVNLAAPLTLVPHAPLKKFSYTLPTGTDPGTRSYGFAATLDFGELLKPLSTTLGADVAASGNLKLTYDPVARTVAVPSATVTLGIGAFSVEGKVFDTLPAIAQKVPLGPESRYEPQPAWRDTLPSETPTTPQVPGAQIVLTIDLAKLIPTLGGKNVPAQRDEPSGARRAR